jgi:hypothetical protein
LRDYVLKNKERVYLLQTLLQNEISRLRVWANVTANPAKEMPASVKATSESNITVVGTMTCQVGSKLIGRPQDVWAKLVRKAWTLAPAIAIHMGERFKVPAVQAEITRLVKLSPKSVVDVPEALQYLLGLELQRDALSAIRVSVRERRGPSLKAYLTLDVVVAFVGSRITGDSGHLFPTQIRQSPIGIAIRYAHAGAIPCQFNVLLRPASRASSSF